MADDIKIRVGVQSSVKQDMDRLVADMGLAAKKVSSAGTLESMLARARSADAAKRDADILGELKYSLRAQQAAFRAESERLGRSSADAFTEEFGGSRFRIALNQALRGNFSAAFEAISGSATGWGSKIAGALTAGFVGWGFGKKIDAALGLSDKIGNLFADVKADKVLKARADAWKALRVEAEKARDAEKKARDVMAQIDDVLSKNEADLGGTPADRLRYESRKLEAMRGGLLAPGLSREEKLKRELAFEEQVGRVNMASRDVERWDSDQEQQRARLQKQQWVESQRAEQEAEEKKRAAAQQTADFLAEMRDKRIQEEIKATEKEIELIKRVQKADEGEAGKRAERRRELGDIIDQADNRLKDAGNGANWRDAKDAERNAEREKRRRDNLRNEAEKMRQRGGKIPERWQAFLDADKARAVAEKEMAKIDALDKAAKQAQVDALGRLDKLNALLEKVNQMRP